MDPIKLHRKKSTQPILQTLFKFLFVTIGLGLFLSSPLWLPFILFSLNSLNSLFLMCNLIIVILFGQSKLSMSSSSSSSCDIYEEYVRIQQRLSTSEVQVEKDVDGEREEERHEEDEEGDRGLDELNRRVEDFIARVNKQRRIEARMMMACGGKEKSDMRICDWINAN